MPVNKNQKDLAFHEKVSSKVFSEAIQHPTTLFPAAVSILASAQMALMSPSQGAFAIALASGLLSVASFVYHYFISGEKKAARFAREIQRQYEQDHLSRLNDIITESRQEGFQEGVKEGQELEEAYLNLTRYLKDIGKRGSDRATRFLILAEDCYKQGLNILHDALETHKVIFTFPIIKLNDERDQWYDQLKDLNKLIENGNTGLTIKKEALESKINNHQTRIKTYQEKRNRLEQLMAELESLESALETAHMEAVDLISGKTLKNVAIDPANRLEQAVNAAKKVEERLTRMTSGNAEDDQIYTDAAK